MHTYLALSVTSEPHPTGRYLQWEICFQRVILRLLLGLLHQRVEILLRHMQPLSERVKRQGRKQLVDIVAVGLPNASHSRIWTVSVSSHHTKTTTGLTGRPCRQWERNHLGVDLHQACTRAQIPQRGSNPEFLSILQGTHVLLAPSSQGVFIGDGAVVRLHVEVYLDHLHPTSGLQHPLCKDSVVSTGMHGQRGWPYVGLMAGPQLLGNVRT